MTANIADLEAELAEALDVYKNVYGRAGSALAIKAVIDFLLQSGVKPPLIAPLHAVIAEFADLEEQGNQKPAFEVIKWARAAGAVTILMRSGLSLDNASQKVSRAIGGVVSASQLVEFRKNIGKGRVHGDAQKFYQETLQMWPDQEPSSRAKLITDFVRDTVSMGAKKKG